MKKVGSALLLALLLITGCRIWADAGLSGASPAFSAIDSDAKNAELTGPANPAANDAGFAGLVAYYAQAATGGLIPENDWTLLEEDIQCCIHRAGAQSYLVIRRQEVYQLFTLSGEHRWAEIAPSLTGYYLRASEMDTADVALGRALTDRALALLAEPAPTLEWSQPWQGSQVAASLQPWDKGYRLLLGPETAPRLLLYFAPEYEAVIRQGPLHEN